MLGLDIYLFLVSSLGVSETIHILRSLLEEKKSAENL